MGRALQVLSGRVTNPGATITALTANAGDTFAVRNASPGSNIWLEELWAQAATPLVLRLRSNLLHDNSQGIRLRASQSGKPLLPIWSEQLLQAQDLLTFEASGGAAETDVGAALLYYEDLPGAAARLAMWEEIESRVVDVMGAECAMTTGATVGQYGGGQAVTLSFDTFQRNRDYALLGYLSDVSVGVVGVTGADTGNIRVGGPGNVDPIVSRSWFVDLAKFTGRPHIPVFNASNLPATTIDLVHTAAAAAVNVTLIFALLSGPGGVVGAA